MLNIMGLQKLTLLDFPEKPACTVFTGGCNFRCPFCHNADLVFKKSSTPEITEEDFFAFLKKRSGLLEGVCITGGEPTLQPDLELFISHIREMGFSVKLDTNGFLPNVLINLCEKGLIDYVAMDIKSSPNRYSDAVGINNFNLAPVKQSIDYLINSDIPYEFRTTVVKELHNVEIMKDIGKFIKGAEKYFLQEFKDSGNLICDGLHGYTKNEMEILLNALKNDVPCAKIRGV